MMKIKKWGGWAFILVLIILNTNLIFQLKNDRKQMSTKFINASNKINSLKTSNSILKTNWLFYIENELENINNLCVYKGNDSLKAFKLFDKIVGPTLVYRFSGESCNLCIDFGIDKLKEVFDDYANNDQIILLGSKLNPRVREDYYDKKVWGFCKKNMGLSLENHEVPFFFLVDEERKTKMLFVPDKSLPTQTNLYLKKIKKILTHKTK